MGRLIHCGLSYLQNLLESARCDPTHIFSLKAILQVAHIFKLVGINYFLIQSLPKSSALP
jgi:hypothetical protein